MSHFYITESQHRHPVRNALGSILIFFDPVTAATEYRTRFPESLPGIIELSDDEWEALRRSQPCTFVGRPPKTEVEAVNELTDAIKQLVAANNQTTQVLASVAEPMTRGQILAELARLDKRKKHLEMRMKSADLGYSRRWSGLNSQTYRHRLARIQEREIELRELLAKERL